MGGGKIVQCKRDWETAATLSHLSQADLSVSKQSSQSTWSLIQYAKLVAVSPSLDAAKDHDDDPQWLGEVQSRLKASTHIGLMDDTFLPAPAYKLTLTFDEGSQRVVLFGNAPIKIHACRILIDGNERCVASPGLPEYDRITSRCPEVHPQTVQPTSETPYSPIAILISSMIYFLYLILS
jgi:hypothetical protein